MFLQRKDADAFPSKESLEGFVKMMTAFVFLLEDLRRGGKCAVLSDEVVSAWPRLVGGELYRKLKNATVCFLLVTRAWRRHVAILG